MKRNFTIALIVVGVMVLLGILVPFLLVPDRNPSRRGFLPSFPSPSVFPSTTFLAQSLLDTGEQALTPGAQTEPATPGRNCTYNIYYWKDHPDGWPEQLVIGGTTYSRAGAETLIGGDQIPIPAPDPAANLIQQAYVAFLNIRNGANSTLIEDGIAEANQWLLTNPPGEQLSLFNRQLGQALAQDLERYNNGEIGPGPCEGQPPTPSPTLFVTETLTPTPRPGQPVPTATRATTRKPGPGSTPVPPPNTAPPPASDTPQPDKTAPPRPTNSPPPPTQTPRPPTATSGPPTPTLLPPTPLPTDIPLPTSSLP